VLFFHPVIFTHRTGFVKTFRLLSLHSSQFSSDQELNSRQFSLIRVSDCGFYINGKTYTSVEEMPDSIWKEYKKTISESQDVRENIMMNPGEQ
jgi:hypothetical protein